MGVESGGREGQKLLMMKKRKGREGKRESEVEERWKGGREGGRETMEAFA